jgi:hypothetical protein
MCWSHHLRAFFEKTFVACEIATGANRGDSSTLLGCTCTYIVVVVGLLYDGTMEMRLQSHKDENSRKPEMLNESFALLTQRRTSDKSVYRHSTKRLRLCLDLFAEMQVRRWVDHLATKMSLPPSPTKASMAESLESVPEVETGLYRGSSTSE